MSQLYVLENIDAFAMLLDDAFESDEVAALREILDISTQRNHKRHGACAPLAIQLDDCFYKLLEAQTRQLAGERTLLARSDRESAYRDVKRVLATLDDIRPVVLKGCGVKISYIG